MKTASKNSEVLIGISDTPTKLVNVSEWSMSTTRNTIDISTIGTEWKEFLTGQITATGSFNLIYDTTDTTAQAVANAIKNGSNINVYIRPLGSTAGSPQTTFDALITSWDISAATESAITIAVQFQATGAITEGTISE